MSIERHTRLEGVTIRISREGSAFAHIQKLTWLTENGVSDPASERYLPVEPAAVADLEALLGETLPEIITRSQQLAIENEQLRLEIADLRRSNPAHSQAGA